MNVPANQTPTITATAASNGSIVSTPAPSIPGTATIVVTSEDGSTTQTYTVLLDPAFAWSAPVATDRRARSACSVSSTSASFGTFTPGVAQTYTMTIGATVTTTAQNTTLTAADANAGFPAAFSGHLVNTAVGGPYDLPSGLQVDATDTAVPPSSSGSGVFTDLSITNPAPLLSYSAPVSNDPVTLGFEQVIGASDPLRTGSYSKAITFTLSTNTP